MIPHDPEAGNNQVEAVMAAISHLPEKEQEEVILKIMAAAIKDMRLCHIDMLKFHIKRDMDLSLPITQSAIDLLDGHMALREIGGIDGWR